MKKVKVIVIYGEGINTEEELKDVFQRAGGVVDIVHIQDLISRKILLSNYHILGIPGGFSFGDHLGSGKLLSSMMLKNLKKDLEIFLSHKKLIIGICNGFQILVKMGLLPFKEMGNQSVSISFNKSLRFENRWVRLKVHENHRSIWLKGIDYLNMLVRHGEGRLVFKNKDICQTIVDHHLNALSYIDDRGEITEEYPMNPNGSSLGIAALSDSTGQVLGLMPHPEAYRIKENAPSWMHEDKMTNNVKRLIKDGDGEGMSLFYNGIGYVMNNLF